MAENQPFGEDNLGPTTTTIATTFSQLLFAPDNEEDHNQIFNYSVSDSGSSFAIENPPKMLCFGSKKEDEEQPQLFFKSRLTCSDSSSASSPNNISINGCGPKSDCKLRRRNGSNPETATVKAAPSLNRRASKKIKTDAPCAAGHAKRKEKLGERITALQQLVSPFGKTDTASVLHEAMGYIKFLHEQVQVLCGPYLQPARGREKGEETERDLKSRGLCLIPVDCSLHLANCTVADFWSPAMAMGKKL